ncbi:hypothetical protein ONS96_014248 [Cadophora gregata f. sp. sojae]|nr:hypothetical protein ONS96_014248 [Cadophora gregata f. sp. sojae]
MIGGCIIIKLDICPPFLLSAEAWCDSGPIDAWHYETRLRGAADAQFSIQASRSFGMWLLRGGKVVAEHTYMHACQLADARLAARRERRVDDEARLRLVSVGVRRYGFDVEDGHYCFAEWELEKYVGFHS